MLKPKLYLHNRVEIYPREGTETMLKPKLYLHNRVEIYPREGTETFAFFSSLDSLC